MATIKDIAREAGVSHGTVSNVLNKTGKVSIEKIKLVEEAARKLGYVPNSQAQMLRQGSPASVAVLLPSLYEKNYLELYSSLQFSLEKEGYETLIYSTDDIAAKERTVLSQLPLSRLAAVISVSCLIESDPESYDQVPCPVIFVERGAACSRSDRGFLSFDFTEIGDAVGRYILNSQKKRPALFTARSQFRFSNELFSGLSRVLSEKNIPVQKFTSDFSLMTSKAFELILEQDHFDAILASGTMRADAAAFAANTSGNGYHSEIIALTESVNPQYTCYETNYSRLGTLAAEILIRHIKKKHPLPDQAEISAHGFRKDFSAFIKRSEPTVISMLAPDTPSIGALEKLLPMFEEISGIQVKIATLPYEDLHTQISMMNSRFHYDLIRMDVARLDTLGADAYLPIHEWNMDAGQLSPILQQRVYDRYSMINGTRYALPFDPSVQILLYRKDLFEDALTKRAYYEKYQESLTVPSSIEQYLRIAEFFNRDRNPDSPVRFGTAVINGAAVTAASDFLPFLLSKLESPSSEKSVLLMNSPEMITAMNQYKRLAEIAVPQKWWIDTMKLFAEGETAMSVIYSNYAAYAINSKHSSIAGNIGAAIVPGRHPLLGGGVLGISKYSGKIEECRKFFSWYYSEYISSLLVQLGSSTPLLSAQSSPKYDRTFPWLNAAEESFGLGVRGISGTNIRNFSTQQYEFAIGSAISNLLNGIMSAEEAASFAQAIYDSSQSQFR